LLHSNQIGVTASDFVSGGVCQNIPHTTDGQPTMSSPTLRNSLSALAAAATLALSGAAGAAFYGSDFDPPYFLGGAVFEVSDACLATNGEIAANSGSCTPVNMQASPLPFVDLNDGTHTATLNFAGFADDFDDMVKLAVIDGKFAGIKTDPIGGFLSTGSFASFFPGYFFLRFDYVPTFSGGDDLDIGSLALASSDSTLVSVKNFVELINCPINDPSSRLCEVRDTSRTSTFALIPEPGSLALILGGLGAGWWTRRRKTAA
jgi:hypothetical protein